MAKTRKVQKSKKAQRVRYAVVGQGYFAQSAILPPFKNVEDNSQLVALFSGEKNKLRGLGKKYRVPFALPYEEYEDFLASGEVDAVFIALPNHMHRDFTV